MSLNAECIEDYIREKKKVEVARDKYREKQPLRAKALCTHKEEKQPPAEVQMGG